MAPVDTGLFGPGSVTWRIHSDPSMFIGGIRALLLQALHPLAMAGVEDFGGFRDDAAGRLARTSAYVATTTFGTTAEAEAAGARVRAIHRHVRGVDAYTGLPYRADDPELLAWVHNVEVHSFLLAHRTYGSPLTDREADRYVAEMVAAARLVGLADDQVPHDLAGLRAALAGVRGLQVTPSARRGVGLVLSPPLRGVTAAMWPVLSAAAVGLLPGWVREGYGLRWFPPAAPAVRVAAFGLCRALHLTLGPPPEIRAAMARAA